MADEAEPSVRRQPAAGATPAEKRYGSPLAQALADKGVTTPTAGDAAQAAVDKKSGGSPVDSGVRAAVEPHVGADLGGVRVHSDPLSQQSTAAMGARAFAHGGDVFLGPGESATDVGLMAHELTHVVQQGAAGEKGAQRKLEVGAANSPAEQQADAVAGAVVGGAAPQQLIVDDKDPVADGQMNRTAFMAALKPQVMKAAEDELGFIRSIVGCPYIEKYFNLYSQRDARTIESAARKFAPGARNAKSANEMIAPIVAQVREGVRAWVKDGSLIGPAAELDPAGASAAKQSFEASGGDHNGTAQTKPAAPSAKPTIDLEQDATRSVGATAGAMAAPAAEAAARSPVAIRDSLGEGRPLDAGTAHRMGDAMGHSFSDVRIHTDDKAAQLARQEDAKAFAVGNQVAFAPGEFQPGTPRGDALLAHELAHVAQMRGASADSAMAKSADTAQSPAHEADADQAAVGVMGRLWGGVKSVGDRVGPALTSGFGLRRCGGGGAADPVVEPKPGPAKLPPHVHVVYAGDMFRIGFESTGEGDKRTFDAIIDYTGAHPTETKDGPDKKQLRLTQPLKQKQLTVDAVIKSAEGSTVQVDVFKNSYDIVKVANEASFDAEKKARKHDFREVMFGVTGSTGTLWVKDPKAGPIAKEQGPAIQEDKPGEATRVIPFEGHLEWQARIDADGDQYKESLVELKIIDKYPSGSVKTVDIAVTQLASGKKQVAPRMTLPDDGAEFRQFYIGTTVPANDGSRGATIYYEVGGTKGQNSTYNIPALNFGIPKLEGEHSIYELSNKKASYSAQLTFPKEAPKQENKSSELRGQAGFWSSELTLGPYHDKFRMIIEPQGSEGRLGIAPLERADPKAILTTQIKMPSEMKPKILEHSGVGIKFDLDGNGAADVELYTAVEQGLYSSKDPEQLRDMRLSLKGESVPKPTQMMFQYREGVWDVLLGKGGSFEAAASVHASASLQEQAKLPTYDEQMDAWDSMMQFERKKALDAGVITKPTYDAWLELSLAMTALRPQIRKAQSDVTVKVQDAVRDRAATAAQKLHEVIKAQSGGMKLKQSTEDEGIEIRHYEDKYTGESKMEHDTPGLGTTDSDGNTTKPAPTVMYETMGFGPSVGIRLREGKWSEAIASYNAQIQGLDQWVVDAMVKKLGDKDPAVKRAQYLAGMRKEVGALEGKKGLKPVFGTFHPSADYKPWEGGITQVPLAMFIWEEGDKWFLKDLHNPADVKGSVDVDKGKDDKHPPHALFEKLNHRKRFPKGIIHYQIPDGPGNKVATTEEKKWHDYLAEIAMVVAIIGLAISAVATAGTTLAIAGGVITTLSAVGGAVAAGADIADQADAGVLDGATLMIDILQIASAVFAVGALGFGRIIMRGAAAAEEGASAAAKAAAPPGWLLNAAKGAYVPMRVGGVAADGLQLLICTDQALEQMRKINEAPGDEAEKDRAKRQIIMALAIQGGFFALSIKGEIPSLVKGMNIGVTMVGKKAIAHVEAHLDPNKIKFSQENIGAKTSDGIPLDDLKNSMKNEGWKGDPIHVVELPDGSHLSLDNRRLFAAREAVKEGGLKGADGKPTTEIPTLLHHHTEPMPQDWASKGFVAEKAVYKHPDGHLTLTPPTPDAKPVIPEGHVAQTFGEAATIRTAKQDKIKADPANPDRPGVGQAFPLGGTIEPPRVRKGGGGGGGGDGGGGGGDNAPKITTVHVDPNNDAARLQTKGIETAAAEAQAAGDKVKYDFSQKSKDGTTTFGAEYKKWIEGPDPVDFSGKHPKANYKGHPEFEGKINELVGEGNITLNLKAHAGEVGVKDLKLESLNPESTTYWKDRQKLVDKFGEDAVVKFENAKLGGASDPARAAVFEQVGKVVGPDAITQLRNAFPDCEIYITGSSSQPGKGKPENLAKIKDLDIVLIVPDGVDGAGRAAYEARAKLMSVPTTPEFAASTKRSSLPIDASARTKENAFGLMTAEQGINPKTDKPFTPLEYARVDANVPAQTFNVKQRGIMSKAMTSTKLDDVPMEDMAELRRMVALGLVDPKQLPAHLQPHLPTKPGIDADVAKAWAKDLADSNPNKMSDAEIEADLKAYLARKEHVQKLYEKAKSGEIPESDLPGGCTLEELKLAVEGDANGQRVPLTFSVQKGSLVHDVAAAKAAFESFQTRLQAIFAKHGITDAVVVQLGSGTTGWSTAPGNIKGTNTPKVGKKWSPGSDTDFAIFSDQALVQAMEQGAIINPKNQQAGKFTTIKNEGINPGERGFGDTKLGQDLIAFGKEMDLEIYGKPVKDGFDFKLNLDSSKPFRSAVPVLQAAHPKLEPLHMGAGGVHAEALTGGQGGKYLSVEVADPRHILPPGAKYPRDYHITIVTPPEYAALPPDKVKLIENGIDIPGTPQSGDQTKNQFAGIDVHKLKVTWEGANKVRADLGLPPKDDMHVTLSGGIGDAVKAQNAQVVPSGDAE